MAETTRTRSGVQQYIRGSTPQERLDSVNRAIDAAEKRNDVELVRRLRRAVSDEVWKHAYRDDSDRSADSSESSFRGFMDVPRDEQPSTENTGKFMMRRRKALGRAAARKKNPKNG